MTGAPEHAWGRRGALRVDGRAVHYRRTGQAGGPVVILLHGSPESASALHQVARALEDRFDVIGLDTAGNGLSEPLPVDDPDSEDYARWTRAVMDALGVARAGLYGFHTGAGTAMSLALIAPERVSGLALDGYAVWTNAERAALLSDYCVVYPPIWDGSHLARIWARLEEQLIFFPWHDRRIETRMDLPPTPIDIRLRRLRDWLTANETYPAPYRAAFKRRGEIGPDRVEIPTLIGASPKDPLALHLGRLTTRTPSVTVEPWPEDRGAAIARLTAHLAEHPGDPAGRPDPGEAGLLARLARPQAHPGWTPDDHGGFLLKLWRDLRLEAIGGAWAQQGLDEGLDPTRLNTRAIAAIQAKTGL